MEEGRNIPLIIMLSAGSIISIACIIYKFSMMETLLLVLGTLIIFYIIGLIVKKIILSINHDAEERAALLAQEEYEAKQKELAEQEEIATQDIASTDFNENISVE
ncbi:MAG: hypothetical protein IJ420_03340 [Lachnospiraceae bacterium]|nr:hypothetical protein [Lachnospiraceae bacterium]MBQ8632616.1 hypothetical protein [Lachnospiraceae bacterium]MBQ8877375.1 hypothetical protein [Lachnospiraceae bacterium]